MCRQVLYRPSNRCILRFVNYGRVRLKLTQDAVVELLTEVCEEEEEEDFSVCVRRRSMQAYHIERFESAN